MRHDYIPPAGLFTPQAYDGYGTGTVYALTATPSLLALGTGAPTVTIDVAGTYRIRGVALLNFAGATFAASRNVTVKLRRTNNTAADLTNGSVAVPTGITTTLTALLGQILTPDVVYVAAAGDIISLFGDVSVVPSAGALNAAAASVHAERVA